MTSVTRSYLVDDLDGSTENVNTIQFTLDNMNYEIDLSAKNEARLRDKLAKFLDAATPVRQQHTSRASRRDKQSIPAIREQTQAVRDWAKGAGYAVAVRGRIPKNVQEAYDQAH